MSDQSAGAGGLSPSRQIMQYIWPAAHIGQALHVAAKLGIADLISDAPRSSCELADATSTDGPALYRVLRGLTTLGIFAEDEQNKFRNTPLSEALRTDHPESVRAGAIMMGAPFLWRPWGELLGAVTTGQPAFDRVFGQSFFDYLTEHPDDATIFNAVMTSGASATVAPVLAAYDFSRFDRIVDVGGGHGALLKGIVSANPNLQGVLFDLPHVVGGAEAMVDDATGGQYEVVGGDFFQAVPEGADAYIVKGVIHDWSDRDAVRILSSCRRAIKPSGRLLLIESILRPSNQPDPSKFMDLMMLVLVKGRERSESDFRELLQKAGFSLMRIIPTTGSYSIIEGQPI
jgi:SAM-dependent methyltransferase